MRDRLRAGDVWVDGSREYRRFDSYLMPRDKAETAMRDAGFETDPEAWLSDRRAMMAKRFDQVDRALKRKALPGVRIERGRLKITPHDAVTPPAALRLERAIDAVMPRIRITELLWEVNAQTGFLDAFTDLRSGKQHDEPAAMLATILAGATNLGLERMAHASSRVSHAQLTWAQTWYLRPETFADALGRSGAKFIGWSVLRRPSWQRAHQRQVRARPRPEDLLLPVGPIRIIPLQRHRGDRRRSPIRA